MCALSLTHWVTSVSWKSFSKGTCVAYFSEGFFGFSGEMLALQGILSNWLPNISCCLNGVLTFKLT